MLVGCVFLIDRSGAFFKGKKQGAGTYTYANGDVYQGQWLEDLKHGSGTYTYASIGVKVRRN